MTKDEETDFNKNMLPLLNTFLKTQFVDFTCEDVVMAYTLACAGKMDVEVFSILAPKFVGKVLVAYREQIMSSVEFSRIFTQQMLIDPPGEMSEDDINEYMEKSLAMLICQTAAGQKFNDIGNGMYKWLYKQGYLRPDGDLWQEYINKGIVAYNQRLVAKKQIMQPRSPGEQSLYNNIEKTLEMIQAETWDKDMVAEVRSEAMKIAVVDYLCHRAGTDPDELGKPKTVETSTPAENEQSAPI